MIMPERIEEEARRRKPKPMYDFAMVAELSALHELSALAFAETEEQLAREAVEKVTRLFGARGFAVLSGRPPRQRLALASGCKSREEVLSRMARMRDPDHQLWIVFNENTEDQDVIYFEQARPLDDRIRRLYNVFARRLEDRLGAFRQEVRRREAEEALRRSEARFQRALENIPVVVAIYDADLRIRFINAATKAITGRSPADLIGKHHDEVWPTEVCGANLPLLRRTFASGQSQSVEIDLELPETGRRRLSITCVPLAGKDGRTDEVVGITQDLTERKARKKRH